MDQAHKETDEKLKRLEAELNKEYEQAAKEVEKKMNDHLSKFQVKDEIKRRERDAGKITGYVKSYARMKGISEDKINQRVINDSYNYWRTGQLMMGKRWEEMRDTLAEDLTNVDKIAMNMVSGNMKDVYALNHNYGTFEVEKGSLIDTSYTLYNRETVENLMKNNPDLLPTPKPGKEDLRWNKQNIQSQMMQGILQGESIPQISKRVALGTTTKDKQAAIRNARTMTTCAENAGRVDSYKRVAGKGIDMVQIWVAALDNRTRSSHRILDGYKLKVGGKFPNGCRYPGDPEGPGEEIWNCRCALIGQVAGVDYNLTNTSERNEKLGTMTYDEWLNSKPVPKHYGESVKHYTERINNRAVRTNTLSPDRLVKVSAQDFHDAISNAKASMAEEKRWRVDVHTVEEYAQDNIYMTPGGSVIAVTPEGDIVSVCRNSNDTVRGSDLLRQATEKYGGRKLDSYAGNNPFYVSNGFEPVSWCEWDDEFAPAGWKPEMGRENIIFYRYTGAKGPKVTADDFLKSTPASPSYDAAQKVRDDLMKGVTHSVDDVNFYKQTTKILNSTYDFENKRSIYAEAEKARKEASNARIDIQLGQYREEQIRQLGIRYGDDIVNMNTATYTKLQNRVEELKAEIPKWEELSNKWYERPERGTPEYEKWREWKFSLLDKNINPADEYVKLMSEVSDVKQKINKYNRYQESLKEANKYKTKSELESIRERAKRREQELSSKLTPNDMLILDADSAGIKYKQVELLDSPLDSDAIIRKLAGGDKTSGSCASLALAYMGNKNGYDVTDYRGGDSRTFFSRNTHALKDLKGATVKVKNGKTEQKYAIELMGTMEQGKDYILITGRHAAVVRKQGEEYQYLEMQSSSQNGWKSFGTGKDTIERTLKWRFDAAKRRSYGTDTLLIDTSSVPDDFQTLLGFMNTKTEEQKKGFGGTIK
jgi:hypothetical protein